MRGIHWWLEDSPHKPVARKLFPFDDVVMLSRTPDISFWHTSSCVLWSLTISAVIKQLWRSLVMMNIDYSMLVQKHWLILQCLSHLDIFLLFNTYTEYQHPTLTKTRSNRACTFHILCPCLWYGFILFSAWISNHMSRKVWDGITYPFPNFNGCSVEVCGGYVISATFCNECNYISMLGVKSIHINKRG